MTRNAAWVTLLTKSEYLPGALVVDQCLKSVGSKYPLVVMATSQLPQEARLILSNRDIPIRDISRLKPQNESSSMAELDSRFTRFADTWTKLQAFELVEYDRVVLIDSDMVVLRNMDELMDHDLPSDWIAAVHACACNPRRFPHYPDDWIPENCAYSSVVHPTGIINPPVITDSSPRPYKQLNSGLVILTPSLELANDIHRFLMTSPLVSTFAFPDQDLLAAYFEGRWKVLPYVYNALKTLRVIHKPLWRDEEVRCLHYIFHEKPWSTPPGSGGEYGEIDQWWWDRYEKLGEEMSISDKEGWELVDSHVTRVTPSATFL
ncbi:unnamed protein product [Somion occarium]|uniref:Galactinol synthase n=1 Tax=Somion occarium TaxID=3059160 RepID=A0ABP1CN58_9APHY